MSYFQDASPESLGISSGGILRFLDRMEEKGLIRRTADENVRQRAGGSRMHRSLRTRCIPLARP